MISEWSVVGTGSFPPLHYTQPLFTALLLWLVFWDENTQEWNTMVDLPGWDTNKSYVANQVRAAAGRCRHRLETCHSTWFGLCTNSSLNDAPGNLLATCWQPETLIWISMHRHYSLNNGMRFSSSGQTSCIFFQLYFGYIWVLKIGNIHWAGFGYMYKMAKLGKTCVNFWVIYLFSTLCLYIIGCAYEWNQMHYGKEQL